MQMGQWMQLVIEDDRGNHLTPLFGFPPSCLPDPDDHRYNLLRFIDPYGDTVFNRIQVAVLIEKLHRLVVSAR
jgi:hypothetical protein